MYKNDIVRKVARDTRLSQKDVRDALNGMVQVVTQALREGKTVTLPGFGTFYTSNRREGTVKHIKTKQVIKVPARRVAAFRVGALLKKSVRNEKEEKRGKKRSMLRKALHV